MSPDGGRTVRAYRPSRFGTIEQNNEDAEMIRLANLKLYANRVNAGRPIFDEREER